jgi:hypothetical protein
MIAEVNSDGSAERMLKLKGNVMLKLAAPRKTCCPPALSSCCADPKQGARACTPHRRTV